jgi:hypothetical protein
VRIHIAHSGRCSECGAALSRYFAAGFLRWPETCGQVCARKRKTRLQFERRQRRWEERLFLAGKTPFRGFKFFKPPTDVCLTAAPVTQSTVETSAR